MDDYKKTITQHSDDGKINDHFKNKLLDISQFGMTPEVFKTLLNDAVHSTQLGISSDEDHAIKFFIRNNADDIFSQLFDQSISNGEKDNLCQYYIKCRHDNAKFDDLLDVYITAHKWLCDKHKKKAYPNTMGKIERDTVFDRDKWVDTVKIVYSMLDEKNIGKEEAIKIATNGWDSDETYKFTNWLRYYESKTPEKYNVKTSSIVKKADTPDLNLPSYLTNPANRSNMHGPISQVNVEKTRREEEFAAAQRYKKQMKSRLISILRLLDKYNDVMPVQNIESVQESLNLLMRNIGKLSVRANIQSCIVRTANVMKHNGFSAGANELYKIAEEPLDPATPAQNTPTDPSAQGKEDVIDSLPEPSTPEPDLPTDSAAMIDVQTIIGRLEGVSKKLKSRDTIRELASIDILLNEMGMASFFPELTDAQAKLIEAYSYASNKAESMVAKLRGTGTVKSLDKKPAVPQKGPLGGPKKENIDLRQVSQQPVSKVKQEVPVR